MRVDRMIATLLKALAAAVIVVTLSGCSTTQALDVPKPTPREEPINSLALEQCIRAHGAEKCSAESR